MKRTVATLLLLVMLLSGGLPAFAADGKDPSAAPSEFRGDAKKVEDLADAKKVDDPVLQKLDSSLLPLADGIYLPEGVTMAQYQGQMEELGSFQLDKSVANGKSADGGALVYVYITVKKGSDFERIQPYVQRVANQKGTLAAAWVSAEKLPELAAQDCVVSVSEVTAPVINKMDTSEGVGLHRADLAQALSNGSGVKIGVISDGVDSLSNVVGSGDLPGNVTVLSNARGGDEGTAMLEIVYDMAPGAQLYFHDSGTNILAFNAAVDALVANGCTVICDDVGWITQPFFEDGVIASHFKQIAESNNVLFVSSAGNSADKHYQGMYMESVGYGNGWHDFSHGTSSYEDIYVSLDPGGVLKVVLQWKEPFGSSALSDYDLYFVNPYTGYVITSSKGDNLVTQQPMEFLTYANFGSSPIDIAVSVKRYSAPTPRELEVFIYGGDVYSDNIVKADSIFGHAAVPGVIACGAIDPQTPASIEDFSSQGPVTTLTGTRSKPDVCGADGVDVTGAGGFSDPFYGTSAAAPHVAAIAALVKARFPQYTPAEIAGILTQNSTDLGTPGYDSVFGYGLVDAYAAVTSSYYVQFDSQGGSGVATQLVARGSLVGPPAAPARAAYAFDGWFKDAACTAPWNFSADTVNADTMLYAKWTVNTCTVVFDSQGGSAVAAAVVSYGGLVPRPADPARSTYNFTGWYKDAACTAPWNFATDVATANVTLYAGWKAQTPSNTLRGIALSAGKLSRSFSSKVTSYTVTLGENDGAVTVTPLKAYSGASMTIDGKKVSSKTVKLANGSATTMTVKVTWNKKTMTYKLTIKRPKSSNNKLSKLTASAGTWSQPFDPAVTSYKLTLPKNVSKVTIKATRASSLATVTPASKTYSLKNGQTIKATVKVKSQAGKIKTYTITITRAK